MSFWIFNLLLMFWIMGLDGQKVTFSPRKSTPSLECGGWDLNPRTARDRILSPAPLAELGYPREHPVDVVDTISVFLDGLGKDHA